ncbi:MAG: hypothetical protein LBR45_04750 [Bacteroidales bacterium]|nr:hypothetical protein [Bacteroidales bacterium]
MLALIGAVALVATSCGGKCTYEKDKDCFCKENPNDPRCSDCTFEEDPACFCDFNPADPRCIMQSNLPDSIVNGSNFYIIYMDAVSEASLSYKVAEPTMLRDYDIWPAGQTLEFVDRLGINSWGEPSAWISANISNGSHMDPPQNFDEGWNGGGIVAVLSEFETVPDLSPVMEGGYYLHFAIKSPTNQPNAGHSIIVHSEGPDQKYYLGPTTSCPGDHIYLSDYPHDGEWHHFEIPVDEMVAGKFSWTEPLNEPTAGRRYLFSFMGIPHVIGNELNMDAIFYYKKPVK